jgi:isopentenyldiphosphate isomerase
MSVAKPVASAKKHPCQWCGALASHQVTVAPAKIAKKRLVARELLAYVCEKHLAMVQRNQYRAELQREIATLVRQAQRSDPQSAVGIMHRQKVADAQARLAELEAQ